MNASAITLTVNPSAKTLGNLNPDCAENAALRVLNNSALRRRRLSSKMVMAETRRRCRWVRMVWGGTAASKRTSTFLLACRWAFAAVLVVYSLTALGGTTAMIVGLAAAASMAVGCFERVAMYASAVFFSVVAINVLETAATLPVLTIMSAVALPLVCLVMAIAGPGRYSLDAIVRRNIYRSVRRRQERSFSVSLDSYKAYSAI